jgi:hypothetical protein
VTAARAKPESIDQYIAMCSPEVRAVLKQLRSTVKRAAPPETEELISYRMPAFALEISARCADSLRVSRENRVGSGEAEPGQDEEK